MPNSFFLLGFKNAFIISIILQKQGFEIIVVFNLLGQHLSKINCPNREDYSPCICPYKKDMEQEDILLWCPNIPPDDIKSTFKVTTPAIFKLIVISITPVGGISLEIPADVFVAHKVFQISILFRLDNADVYVKPYLKVNEDAFRSSRNITQEIIIISFDLHWLNFSFLTDFNKLNTLYIKDCDNFHLHNLPFLPALETINIIDCKNLSDWKNFPILINGLKRLELSGDWLSDGVIDGILEWIIKSSNETLRKLELENNCLTRIPPTLKSFSRLVRILLDHQTEPGFGHLGAFTFNNASAIIELGLMGTHIKSIAPGFFQGVIVVQSITLLIKKTTNIDEFELFADFKGNVVIDLSDNNMKRFESNIFKGIMEKISNSKTGQIHFLGSGLIFNLVV